MAAKRRKNERRGGVWHGQRSSGARGRRAALLALAGAALAPLVVFWPITGYGFLLDDFVLYQSSPSLGDLHSIARGFVLDVGAVRKGAATVISSYYRPVFLALSTLYHQLAGGEPAAWHAASLVLAAAIGALACGLLLRLGLPPLTAGLGAAVFSLHPSHVSSVAWASGLQELLAALFVLLALIALTRPPRPDDSPGIAPGAAPDTIPLATASACFVLALLCKEVAIALVPLTGLWALAARWSAHGTDRSSAGAARSEHGTGWNVAEGARGEPAAGRRATRRSEPAAVRNAPGAPRSEPSPGESVPGDPWSAPPTWLRRRLGRFTAVSAGLAVAYLGVRLAVLGGMASRWPGAPDLAAALPAVPVALVTYLRLLLWPVGFSILRPERPNLGPFAPAVLAAVAALAALAVLAVWAVRRRRALLLPMMWLLVWLAPVLNLWALDRQWMVTDRYLFLPSLALPWALALLLPRRTAPWVLAALALAFAGLSLRYSAIFASERRFVAAMEVAEPTSPLVFAEKGRLLLRDGDRAGARAALSRAVDLDPAAAGALVNLGDLELQERQLDAAESHYRQALVVRPEASRGFKLLTLAQSRASQAGHALALAQEAARRWPQDFEAQLIAALLLDAAGQRQPALDAFAAASRLRPQDPALAGGLDAAESRLLPGLLPPAAGATGAAAAPAGVPATPDGSTPGDGPAGPRF